MQIKIGFETLGYYRNICITGEWPSKFSDNSGWSSIEIIKKARVLHLSWNYMSTTPSGAGDEKKFYFCKSQNGWLLHQNMNVDLSTPKNASFIGMLTSPKRGIVRIK